MTLLPTELVLLSLENGLIIMSFSVFYNSTYFVEYNFPVSTASKNKFHVDSKASEMMRVASKKVTDGGEW